MSVTILDSFSENSANKRFRALERWVRGAGGWSLASERFGLDFATVKAQVSDDLENTAKTRAEDTFLRALHRDGLYALAGRRRLFELGVNNAFREVYEPGKAAIDMS